MIKDRKAYLLERLAKIIREDKNIHEHFQYIPSKDRNWEDAVSSDMLLKLIYQDPYCVYEKPELMQLGNHLIWKPIHEEPDNGTLVFCVDQVFNNVEAVEYHNLGHARAYFNANLLHYNRKSAHRHLVVLNWLHSSK